MNTARAPKQSTWRLALLLFVAVTCHCSATGWTDEPPRPWESVPINLKMSKELVASTRPNAFWDDSANGFTEDLDSSQFPSMAFYGISWGRVTEIKLTRYFGTGEIAELHSEASRVLSHLSSIWGTPHEKGTIKLKLMPDRGYVLDGSRWAIGRAVCTLTMPSPSTIQRVVESGESYPLVLELTIATPGAARRRKPLLPN